MSKKQQQRREPDGWTWAAAAACEERRHEDRPWGDGDHVAEVLLAREAGDAALLAERLSGEVGRPPGGRSHFDFGAAADELWRRIGLSTDFGSLQPGATYDATPWHLWIETDPKRPYYHRRARLPPDPDLAAGLLAAERNLRPLVTVPGRPPILLAGRRRTTAARHLVHEALAQLVYDLEMATNAMRDVPAPRILGLPPQRESLNWDSDATSVPLLGLLRVEMVDPDSPLAKWAVNGDNDLQRGETPMSLARQVEELRDRYKHTLAEVARMKGISSDTVSNLLSLLKLLPELQDLLEEGALDVSEAYALARVDKGRQRQIYEQTRGIRQIQARITEIRRLGAGEAPSQTRPESPAAWRKKSITLAASRIATLPPRPPDSAEAGARAVLRLLAGDRAGLEAVSPSCRAEIEQLLAAEGKR